jgi:hypothetical protein
VTVGVVVVVVGVDDEVTLLPDDPVLLDDEPLRDVEVLPELDDETEADAVVCRAVLPAPG